MRHNDPASRERPLRTRRLLRTPPSFLLRVPLALAIGLAVSAGPIATGGCTVTNGVVAGARDALFSRAKRVDYRYKPRFGVEDPQFRRTIDSFADEMEDGNTAELFHNGDEIFPAMLGDIRGARASVNLETFIFEDDEAGRMFADALIEVARRGVEVRLLTDGWGANLGDLQKELEAAGVICQQFRPLKFYSLHRPGIRTHRKLLIVDGRIGYTGGLGIAEPWLGDARGPDEWRETQVRVTGPVVAQMQAIFAENWTFSHAEILAGDAFYPELTATGDIPAHALRSSKGDSSSIPKLMYYLAIQSAKRYIHIQNAYFIPDEQVRRALVRAVRRGVDVQVIVPGKHNDLRFMRQASRHHYGELLEGGVKIHEYWPTMIHIKSLVVDGIFSTIGSINFDARSMSINAEESLSFYHRGFAEQMETMFQEDRALCHEVTHEAWKHRGLRARSAEWISWIWEPYY